MSPHFFIVFNENYTLPAFLTLHGLAKSFHPLSITIAQYGSFEHLDKTHRIFSKILQTGSLQCQWLNVGDFENPFSDYVDSYHFRAINFFRLTVFDYIDDDFVVYIDAGYFFNEPHNAVEYILKECMRFMTTN